MIAVLIRAQFISTEFKHYKIKGLKAKKYNLKWVTLILKILWGDLIINKNSSNFKFVHQKSKLFNSVHFGQFFFKSQLVAKPIEL